MLLKPYFNDAGQFYWFNVDKLIQNRKLFTDKTAYYEIAESHVQDLDNEEDWKIAEMKFKIINNL